MWKKLKGAEGKLKSVVLAGFSEDSHSVRDLNIIWLNVHVIAPSAAIRVARHASNRIKY